jgi:Calcineurin-like phosphoesterase
VSSEIQNSRQSVAGAGWCCQHRGTFKDLFEERRNWVPPNLRVVDSTFGWFKPKVLWQSRNDVIASYISDPVNDERRRWVRDQKERPDIPKGFIIDRSDLDTFKFLVVGDPGEGDHSQFALVPLLHTVGEGTDFMIICSDVVYPAGDANEYLHKFYLPYEDYKKPIYAIPGNHDWYDGLNGFMVHFCGSEPSERSLGSNRLVRRLWRKAAKLRPEVLEYCRRLRPELGPELRQPNPYFAIDTAGVRLIGIDTGISGEIDHEQGEWLHEVSSSAPEKLKILLTGKPIYVNGEYHPGKVERNAGTTVDQIVCEPDNNYVAVIGGDIHNYQRYPVRVGDQTIQYVVSGGGGAYTSATHTIPRVGLLGLDEDEFRCYPLRGDSLSFYSRLYDRKYASASGKYYIEPEQAAAYMAERLGITSTRESDRRVVVSERTRQVAQEVFPVSGRRPSIRRYFFSRSGVRRGVLQHFFFSEFFDWNDPPLFKNLLRVEVAADKLKIVCYGATGCKEHEDDPRVEDCVEIQRLSRGGGSTARNCR